MTIYVIGVLASIAVYLLVGLYAGRKVKNVDDYYVSGRNAPTLLIFGTLFASMLSVAGFTGDLGFCYSGNITSMYLLSGIYACGYVMGPFKFGRYLRRSACATMPEFFGTRFANQKNRQVAGVVTVISLTAYLLSCITGVGILMEELTGLPYPVCIFIAWLCFTLFTFYSGSAGVILTDTMMFLLFLFATLLAGPYIFEAQGGLGALLQNLMENPDAPAGLLDYHGNLEGAGATDVFGAVMYSITVGIMWAITVSVSPWQAGRSLMARSEHVTFRAGALAAICTLVFFLYLYLQSVAMINIHPNMEDPQRVMIWAALNIVPPLMGTLMLAGILAAGLSSASTFLSVVGFSVTSDILRIKDEDVDKQLKTSRIVTIIVGIVALVLAYLGLGGIRIVAYMASTIIAASWAVPSFGATCCRSLSATGARWAMIAGFLGYLGSRMLCDFQLFGAHLIFINFLDPFFLGLGLSLIFAVIGSKKYPATQEEKDYFDQLQIIPEREKDPKEYARDRLYAYGLIVTGLATTLFLLFTWALPYHGLL